jgi:nickel-dependent lactate racemase
MSTYYAKGSPDTVFSKDDLRQALKDVFNRLGPREKIIALPPDFTRFYSMAGELTVLAEEYYGDKLVDIMPALGTHFKMTPEQLNKMYAGIDHEKFRYHDFENDVVTIGEVPAAFVNGQTEGRINKPWPCQMNKLVHAGGHDLILSIGQVVPHEVMGMANYNKNIFIGTGGKDAIDLSHFIGAAYGMERIMGLADNPLRRILNYGQDHFCSGMPLVYILTVIGADENNVPVCRGLYIGDDVDCFLQASELSIAVNFTHLDEAPEKIVVWMDPEEFHSTWVGNKAIYRTRMAIADGGELVVLAPGVRIFGEQPKIDELIRKYGYRTSPEILKSIEENEDLQQNLSAAAHLIHGSPEGRFTVTYCPGDLTREEIEGVGFQYEDLAEMQRKYNPETLAEGWNDVDGERVFFIGNPALGLWAHRDRLAGR